ncbi:hypothetical protein FG379_000427 [Cryptosporidium bovis]|uniref:uncharacterized protein n=1 Tax=Cryptosporidium bovis TaxID=310047 RepID=UPI00351A5719|nr:hypothetical protein FG379_000427 [Cryptosporidium bovis]
MRTVAKETVLKKNEKNVACNIRNRSPLSILKDKLLDLKNRTQEERITRLKLIERDFEIIKKVFEEHVKLTFLKLNISVESIGAAKGESAENIIYNTSSNSNVVYGIKSNDDSNKDQPVKIGSDISGAENNLSIGAVPCGSNIEKLETNIHLTTATVKTGEMIINNNLNPGYVFNSRDKILSSSVFEKVERGNNGILYKNHIIGNSTVQTVNQINNVAHPYYNHSVYNSGKINQIKTDNQIIQETKRIFTDDI